jgi:hypothetical protein
MSTPAATGPTLPIKSALKSEDEGDNRTPPGSASMKGLSHRFGKYLFVLSTTHKVP